MLHDWEFPSPHRTSAIRPCRLIETFKTDLDLTTPNAWLSKKPKGTVDGRNPAPVDRQFIPLFTGLYTSQVWLSNLRPLNWFFPLADFFGVGIFPCETLKIPNWIEKNCQVLWKKFTNKDFNPTYSPQKAGSSLPLRHHFFVRGKTLGGKFQIENYCWASAAENSTAGHPLHNRLGTEMEPPFVVFSWLEIAVGPYPFETPKQGEQNLNTHNNNKTLKFGVAHWTPVNK